MITVQEATDLVLSQVRDFGTERIPLQQSISRVLRETIEADRDFPPYDRVTMDGIALRWTQFEQGQRSFRIEGIAAAGDPQKQLLDASNCLEVMTGSSMPLDADVVIKYEEVQIEDGVATVEAEVVKQWQNIHFKGSDRKAGSVIIQPGTPITAAEIGVCATVGKAEVLVSKMPKTLILSSGDELVNIEDQPLPHQIRRSNVFLIQTALQHFQMEVDTAHLADDYDSILNTLRQHLIDYDLLILSGGVSKGKFDYLPDALNELGVEKHFHKVKQRPGKPFWFGSTADTTVFAFPGNPVSSFVCMQQYFRQWLSRSIQLNEQPWPNAQLSEAVTFKRDLTYFLEVSLASDASGTLIATPVKGNGSGDLANLVDVDAFMVLPQAQEQFAAGEAYPVIVYR